MLRSGLWDQVPGDDSDGEAELEQSTGEKLRRVKAALGERLGDAGSSQ